MKDNFYRSFEERYYAPRGVIKELRRQYLPFVAPLAERFPGEQSYDAGCGRGEWLELMLEQGLDPLGVDLDEGMLSACVEGNLPAQKGDAVEYMRRLSDESQVVVTAFHVVEHIPFDALRTFVAEAFRVLKPGGILIMETPNPENLVVASSNFYLDPTHQKPIPAKLLAFVTEHEGFDRNKIVRLQEPASIKENSNPALIDVLGSVSPDYSVIAQKPGKCIGGLEEVFEVEYGVALCDLADTYQKKCERETRKLDHGLREIAELRSRLEENEQRLNSALQKIGKVEQDLIAVYSSKSWRLTAPLRRLVGIARYSKVGLRAWIELRPGSRPRRVAGSLARKVYSFVIVRPQLRNRIIRILRRFPRLYYFLRAKLMARSTSGLHRSESSHGTGTDFSRMGPRLPLDASAQRYYQELVCDDFGKE